MQFFSDTAGRIDPSAWDDSDSTDPAFELEHEEIVERASARPIEEPWIDSMAHAVGPKQALVYDENGIAQIIPWRGALS